MVDFVQLFLATKRHSHTQPRTQRMYLPPVVPWEPKVIIKHSHASRQRVDFPQFVPKAPQGKITHSNA